MAQANPRWDAPRILGKLLKLESRKRRRCQAITVSGFTITSAVRHPVWTREEHDPEPTVGLPEPNPPRPVALQYGQLVP
jgi:hypothetical protein